jgi:serine/threonine-protein kinase
VKTCPTCSLQYADDSGHCPKDGSFLVYGPGTVIRKKYEVTGLLGRGGMGAVYRARHLVWNEERALKVLIADGPGAQQGLKGLLAEAVLMRQLRHPNIVSVEDVDYTDDDHPFVVMEYVDGQDLSKRIKSGVLLPDAALHFTIQICSALSAAHQKGIVHRDIKPQNLLLAKDAQGQEIVKVIDFGISKVREDAGLGFTGVLTGTTGHIPCTPAYASPEQAEGMPGKALDGRTDLYSLGVVLYEMLTGRWPFAGDNPQALLLQRLHVDPLPLDRARPGLVFAPGLSALVMKALAKDREDRFRSAEEMRGAILALMDSWRAEHERKEREAEAALIKKNQPPRKVLPQPKESGATTIAPPAKQRSVLLAASLAALAVTAIALVFLIADRYRQKEVVAPPPAETAASVNSQPPKEVTNPKDGLIYVLIPPGTFSLGCSPGDKECDSDEIPARQVTIPKAFRIGQKEVTQAAFERVLWPKIKNPSHFKGDPQLPVDSVTWDEADSYCKAIGGRLPTEAEWEYAARGGTTGPRYRDLDDIAWYDNGKSRGTHPVGQKLPNKYGLYDMLGNVWQWTADWYEKDKYRSLRGGSWGLVPGFVRVSGRGGNAPGGRLNGVGFRCIGE